MPWFVNGQIVPEELIRKEQEGIGRDFRWKAMPEEIRAVHVHAAAEQAAIARILVEQAAACDPRPVDRAAVEREVAQQKAQWGCRAAYDDQQMRQWTERQFRVQRLTGEMAADAAKPTADQVEAFYLANRDNFQLPEFFEAAHIVKHVNETQNEEQARTAIEAAFAELENGEPFAAVAERHSDCKGKGIDLGRFPAGEMVPEFEDVVRALQPGQRSGIFRTPFGFHIAHLRTKSPGGPAAFEDVRTHIEQAMTAINQHEAYLRGVAELRSCADIRHLADHEETPTVDASLLHSH